MRIIKGILGTAWFFVERVFLPMGLIIGAMYISLHKGYMTEITRFGCGIYSVYNGLPESNSVSCTENLMKDFKPKLGK